MGVVAGQVFVVFQGVIYDGAAGGPAGERCGTRAERMVADRDVREVATGLGARAVNLAEIAFQKDARTAGVRENSKSGRLAIGHSIEARHGVGCHAEAARDRFDILFVDRDNRVPATIGAGSAIYVLLYVIRQDLKLLVAGVVGGHIAAKRNILCRLGGSEPTDLIEVGNHAPRVNPCRAGRQGVAAGPASATAALPASGVALVVAQACYELRKVTVGSSEAARRAGSQAASIATAPMANTTATYVRSSVALMSYSSVFK